MNGLTTLALVDDHVLLRRAIANLLRNLNYTLVFEADNGQECMEKLGAGDLPDVVIMDLNMPVMDGFETTLLIREQYPAVKVLAISVDDGEKSIIRMLRNGAKGYLLKDSEHNQFQLAIEMLMSKGFYYPDIVTGDFSPDVKDQKNLIQIDFPVDKFSFMERQFLRYVATELTYKEIAREMGLSKETIEGCETTLFEKLGVKSRISLALFALMMK